MRDQKSCTLDFPARETRERENRSTDEGILLSLALSIIRNAQRFTPFDRVRFLKGLSHHVAVCISRRE